MRLRGRVLMVLGGVALAGSIFLPRPGIGSLEYEIEEWASALGASLEASTFVWVDVVYLAGFVLALLYPPLVGAGAALTGLLPGGLLRSRWSAGALLGFHTLFLGSLTYMGIGGIATGDRFMPTGVYWGITCLALVAGLAVWIVVLRARAARRLALSWTPTLAVLAVAFVGVTVWLLAQERHGWSPQGPAAAAIGAIFCLLGGCLASPTSREE